MDTDSNEAHRCRERTGERIGNRIGQRKPSRAAEYIAALYVALLLCTPWLLREAPWLTPPSKGVEIQMSNTAQMQAAAEYDALLARRPASSSAAANGTLPARANPAR